MARFSTVGQTKPASLLGCSDPAGVAAFLAAMQRGFSLSANILMQIGLVVCTGLGFLLTSLKLPHYGVIANLIGQVFWVYSSYRAWREADQIGIFISTVVITLILIYGVTNYWFFGETFSLKQR